MAGTISEEPTRDRLRRIVHGRTEADIVTLQFIGVEAARLASGPLWPQRWTRLQGAARAMIEERLAPEDIMVRATDGFVIAYGADATVDRASAVRRAADLVEELNRIFRADASLAPQLTMSVRTIGVSDLAKSIAQGTPGRLEPSRRSLADAWWMG